MAKKRVPSKEVEVCDICGRELGLLEKCVVCGQEYCHMCKAIVMGCVHRVQACKECGYQAAVLEVVRYFVKPLRKILERRDEALRSLRSVILKGRKARKK